MREIAFEQAVRAVEELCLKAAFDLPEQVLEGLRRSLKTESSPLGRSLLAQILENAQIASQHRKPLCQDTGSAVFFVEMGCEVKLDRGTIVQAVNEGTRSGYKKGYLRKSIVADPLFDRSNTGDNSPPVVHLEVVCGDKIAIQLAPKGGGSENMSRTVMLKPLAGREGVIDFVTRAVVEAGGNPCPPTIVGVGIGGTFEKSALLAKKALLRPMGEAHPDAQYAALEREILDRINASGVGPQGLGGNTTSLAVHILSYPCHIASLPVAVNINCHSARHASVIL